MRNLPEPETIVEYYRDLDGAEAVEHIAEAIRKLQRLKTLLNGR